MRAIGPGVADGIGRFFHRLHRLHAGGRAEGGARLGAAAEAHVAALGSIVRARRALHLRHALGLRLVACCAGAAVACVRSIAGGIDGIAFHDNLKGVYKDRFRALGAKLGVPAFKHQTLRRPETIAWADRQT